MNLAWTIFSDCAKRLLCEEAGGKDLAARSKMMRPVIQQKASKESRDSQLLV